MAHDKSSFILYADQAEVFINLPDDIAGKLIKIIFDYVNDKNPEVEDLLLKVAFAPIKQQLKRDLKDWENVKSNRSTAGKKGMASRWGNKAITKDNAVIPAITNITVNDNVNVNVNDNEKNTVSILKLFRIEECLTVAMNDARWVKANNATTKDLNQFNDLLEKRGIYEKNPLDYKTHFANWNKSGKKELPPEVNQLNEKIKAALKNQQ